jgi:hypothetical protein
MVFVRGFVAAVFVLFVAAVFVLFVAAVVVVLLAAVVVVLLAAVVLVAFAQPFVQRPERARSDQALNRRKRMVLLRRNTTREGLIAFLPIVVALLACGYDNESESGGVGGASGSSENVAKAAIDTGGALASAAGQGVGALIEYESGGKWRIHLVCDTAISSERCHWDILVQTLNGARIHKVTGEELESNDDFAWDSAGAQLVASTDTDVDGMVIEADPGAGLRIDVLIDGENGNTFMYWIGGGAIHRGAPTNPVDLTPTEP